MKTKSRFITLSKMRTLGLATLVCMFISCATYHHELGSTHVAVTSVTRWDDYKEELAPNFEINADKAFKSAIANTLQIENATLNMFSMKVRGSAGDKTPLNIPLSSNNVETFTDRATVLRELPSMSANAQVIDPKTLESEPVLNYLAATALFQEVKLLNRYIQDASKRDKYCAYIIRLQISNQAFRRDEPFDTYANIAFYLSPSSVPATASSFRSLVATTNDNSKITTNLLKRVAYIITYKVQDENELVKLYQSLRNKKSELEITLADKNKSSEHTTAMKEIGDVKDAISKIGDVLYKDQLPIVVPLLVTDNIESALISKKNETIRQVALAMAASYQGIGGDVDFESLDKNMRKALGKNHNSLLTVSRLADNALRVRLGARQASVEGSDTNYQTVPQTHNISLLLLVPHKETNDNNNKDTPVYLGMKTEYRNPEDGDLFKVKTRRWGRIFGNNSDTYTGKRILDEMKEQGHGALLINTEPSDMLQIAQYAQNGNYQGFIKKLRQSKVMKFNQANANRLWLDLICSKIGSDYDMTEFRVPAHHKATADILTDTAFLRDDGEKAIVTINGVRNIEPIDIDAKLSWIELTKTGTNRHAFAAEAIKKTRPTQLTVTFPSLIKFNQVQHGQTPPNMKLSITHNSQTNSYPDLDVITTFALAENPPELTMITLDQVAKTNSSASLNIVLNANSEAKDVLSETKKLAGNPEKLRNAFDKKEIFVFEIAGAELSSTNNTAWVVSGKDTPDKNIQLVHIRGTSKYAVIGEDPFELNLRNIAADKFTLKLSPPDGKDSITKEIQAPN